MRTMLMLVQPQDPRNFEDDAADCDDNVSICSSIEEYKKLWDQYSRISKAMETLGFEKQEHRNGVVHVNLEWCGGEGTTPAQVFEISDESIKVLEGRAAEMLRLRKQAMDKLTPEELAAIGLFKTEEIPCDL